MKTFFLFTALVFFAVSSPAQSPRGTTKPEDAAARPTLPSGPLLRPAADFSQWAVAFVYPDDRQKNKDATQNKAAAAAEAARPRRTMTTKTGQIIHEEQTDVANRVTDLWFKGQIQYRKANASSNWYESNPDNARNNSGASTDANYDPLPANGFRTLDWITADNFAGTVPYANTRECLVFTPGGYKKLDLSDPVQREQRMAAVGQIAYIDTETRLPVAVKRPGELRTYHFELAPTGMQAFPADLADQIKKGEEARARLYQPPPRPY